MKSKIVKFTVPMQVGFEEVNVLETFEHMGRVYCVHTDLVDKFKYRVSDYLTGMACAGNYKKSIAIRKTKEAFTKNPDYNWGSYKEINHEK